jgi:O-antigen ligase
MNPGPKTNGPLQAISLLAIMFTAIACALLIIFGYVSVIQLVVGLVALVGVAVFLVFPEMALAALLTVGTLKAIPQIADSPIDLTVALAVLLIIGTALKGGSDLLNVTYPTAYLLYLPFVAIMLLSLTYTPNFPAGIDKAGRFLVFSGIAIAAPFAVLRTKASLRRFFITLIALGLVVALDSFAGLGGKERLVSAGGDTIQLGHDSALAIVIVWYLLLPGRSLLSRAFFYGLILVFCVGVVGAGSRGPAAGLACCIALSFVVHKELGIKLKSLLYDFGLLTLAVLMVIPIVGIPQSSYDYLSRLGDPNLHRMLGPREALMAEGWRLTMSHPFRGVGIGGYPVLFRGIGAWPHNMFLEISAEMGVVATFLFAVLLWLGFREALRQLRSPDPTFSQLAATVFAFFTMEFIDMMNTGSLNDNRALWLAIALPFVLNNLRGDQRHYSYSTNSLVTDSAESSTRALRFHHWQPGSYSLSDSQNIQ